jgi:hypothetical protein
MPLDLFPCSVPLFRLPDSIQLHISEFLDEIDLVAFSNATGDHAPMTVSIMNRFYEKNEKDLSRWRTTHNVIHPLTIQRPPVLSFMYMRQRMCSYCQTKLTVNDLDSDGEYIHKDCKKKNQQYFIKHASGNCSHQNALTRTDYMNAVIIKRGIYYRLAASPPQLPCRSRNKLLQNVNSVVLFFRKRNTAGRVKEHFLSLTKQKRLKGIHKYVASSVLDMTVVHERQIRQALEAGDSVAAVAKIYEAIRGTTELNMNVEQTAMELIKNIVPRYGILKWTVKHLIHSTFGRSKFWRFLTENWYKNADETHATINQRLDLFVRLNNRKFTPNWIARSISRVCGCQFCRIDYQTVTGNTCIEVEKLCQLDAFDPFRATLLGEIVIAVANTLVQRLSSDLHQSDSLNRTGDMFGGVSIRHWTGLILRNVFGLFLDPTVRMPVNDCVKFGNAIITSMFS